MIDLRPHNEEAYKKVTEMIAEGKKRIAISHATGTGKSYIIAQLCEDYNQDKKLVLVPSNYIIEQMEKLFLKYHIGNTDFMPYQKLIKMSDEDIAAMDYQLIILDEYHHNTSKVWGSKIRHLMNTHPDAVIFGTSATPVRSDKINTIDALFDGNCASELTLSQAIAKKIVPLPKYVAALYTLDDELERLREKVDRATNTKEEKKEFYKRINAMRSQIEKSYGMPIILNKHIKDKQGKYLVFCKDKKHLDTIKDTATEWFKTAGFKDIHAYTVYSKCAQKKAEYDAFCADTSDSLKLLFCVNMLNEGLHLDNISGVLLLRPTCSNIVFTQQIGRAIEAGNKETPIIFDCVNNFSGVRDGMNLLLEIKEALGKEKGENPAFDEGYFIDIDTFFITEMVQNVQDMFTEIEGRLTSSWELYVKALKQYKEREGDCLVPIEHEEILEDGKKVNLGRWVKSVRNMRSKGLLATTGKINELIELGFIWNEKDLAFENHINDYIRFVEMNGRKPSEHSNDLVERKLGSFINYCKMRKEKFPKWRIELLKKIPGFFYEKKKSFDKFCEMVLVYKDKYKTTDIKYTDSINEYNIGTIYGNLKQDLKKGNLRDEQIEKLKKIGIDITKSVNRERYNKNIQLARQAANEGVIVNKRNPKYKNVNLYDWYFTHKNKFSKEEKMIFEKLIPKENNNKSIQIIELTDKHIFYTYLSIAEAGRALCNEFHLAATEKSGRAAILNYLSGKIKKPYKGRFIFQYADTDQSEPA